MLFKRGRQGSGYLNLKLWSLWFFDCYILKYPEGSSIPPHRDPVEGKKHFRFNWEIWSPKAGGQVISDSYLWKRKRMYLFRPDISTHEVTEILSGSRYVLSIGWVTK